MTTLGRTLVASALTLSLLGASSPAGADGPAATPRGLSGAFNSAWLKVQGQLCDRVKARIEQPDAVAKGTTLYDTTCTFGGPGTMSFDASNFSSVVFRYMVPANALDFKAKTALGQWADPKFHVTFDLDIVSHVSPTFGVPPVVVNDATATPENIAVHGGNLTGSVVSMFIKPAVSESIDLKAAVGEALATQWPQQK